MADVEKRRNGSFSTLFYGTGGMDSNLSRPGAGKLPPLMVGRDSQSPRLPAPSTPSCAQHTVLRPAHRRPCAGRSDVG